MPSVDKYYDSDVCTDVDDNNTVNNMLHIDG